MKNLLFFFVLFSLALPMQASASACLYPHLAYQKHQVGKKIVKRILKQKIKPQKDEWDSLILIAIIAFLGLGIVLGLILWLILKGALLLWLLGGILTVILIFAFLRF